MVRLCGCLSWTSKDTGIEPTAEKRLRLMAYRRKYRDLDWKRPAADRTHTSRSTCTVVQIGGIVNPPETYLR
jgi:hypothetical protein